ncbi:MAG: universal stress protein, partial [Gemmatimonadales bacterium]
MAPSILVPLDGSLLAEQALPLAEAVAQALRARMRLALVHQLPPPPLGSSGEKLYVSLELNVRKAQKAYLHRMARTIRGRPRSEIRTAVLEGPVGPAIQKYVQEIGVDLIVMSTHGRGALDRAWLGSVADYLVRTVTVPVLLVHPGAEATSASSFAKPRKIIVPLDGSPLAETVLGPATNLAKALDAEMLLVQVVKPVAIVTDTPGLLAPGFDDQLMSLWRQEAED